MSVVIPSGPLAGLRVVADPIVPVANEPDNGEPVWWRIGDMAWVHPSRLDLLVAMFSQEPPEVIAALRDAAIMGRKL